MMAVYRNGNARKGRSRRCWRVIKDIGEPFEDDQRQDVVLVFRSVERSPKDAGGFPEPIFQGGQIECLAIAVSILRHRFSLIAVGSDFTTMGGECKWHRGKRGEKVRK